MRKKEQFHRRHGYIPVEPEITVREEAPDDLRVALIQIALEAGISPDPLRNVVCRVLRKRPDRGNWSADNVQKEVEDLIDTCDWPKVYDIAEAIYEMLQSLDTLSFTDEKSSADQFQLELNKYFRENGIGWQMIDGLIEIRGPESFESIVRQAVEILEQTGRATAGREIHEALHDLSHRPEPDNTGAVHHAVAALECIFRNVSNDPNPTLGKLLKSHNNLLPKPLDIAVEKIWAYASENARHIREGGVVGRDEAELVVGLSAAVITYLIRKFED